MSVTRRFRRAATLSALVLVVSLVEVDMARSATPSVMFSDGFESGTTSAWSTSGGLKVQQTLRHTGSWAARATSTGAATFAQRTLASGASDVTATEWLDLVSQSSATTVLALGASSSSTIVSVSITKTHRLTTTNAVTGTTLTSSTSVSTGVWHQLQLHLVVGAMGSQEVFLDGVRVAALSGTQNTGTASVSSFRLGGTERKRKYDVVYDDASLSVPADTTPPSTPTGLHASSIGSDTVTLTWTASTDDTAVAGYHVYRNGVLVGTASTTTFTDANLSASTSFDYTVDAFDAAGNTSSPSISVTVTTIAAPDTEPPTVPLDVQATVPTPTEVDLTWTQAHDNVGVTAYGIYRNGTWIAQVAASDAFADQTYADTAAAPATPYTYTVDAVDAAGNRSPPSQGVTVTTPAAPDVTPPSPPGSLSASTSLPTEIDISWQPSTDDTGVVAYRIARDGARIAEVDGDAHAFADTGVEASTRYTYVVTAVDAAGNESSPSSVDVTTPAQPCGATGAGLPTTTALTYRAFADSSVWNSQVGSAPVDCNSDTMIAWLKTDSSTNYVRLGGASQDGKWGNPIYWSGPDDPIVAVKNTCSAPQPPELQAVRIPDGAQPDPTSDAAMTVYDRTAGFVVALHWTVKTSNPDGSVSWSACGGTVYYLASNGLDGRAPGSDEPRNFGHRGGPPPVYAVRWDEIQTGRIDHALKVSINDTCDHVWPYVADEGCQAGSLFPEGTRIRIKPGIDLSTLGLSPAALVVARALQQYGAFVGDQSGGPVTLKLENTVAEGKGWLWSGVLDAQSLSSIPLDDYEVVRRGWDPTA